MKGRLTVVALCGLLATATACGSDEATPGGERGSDTPPGLAQVQHEAGDAFIAFAETGVDKVPWADAVSYSIGGVLVDTFEPGAAVPTVLSACLPGMDEVEGHTCPVSPLEAVAAEGVSPVLEESLPEHVGCTTFSPPKDVGQMTVTVIRPSEDSRDCFSDFAVTLFEDGSGDVAWIDLTLSGP